MKQPLLLLLFMAFAMAVFSQTYISLAPALYNAPGKFGEKTTMDIEIGRQWDVFSLGLDLGKTNLGKVTGKDTTKYVEVRPNLNVFQQGKFTNTLTAAIGYVFGATQNLMTEFTTGIEFTPTKRSSFNVVFGQYYFSGRETANTVTFFGISFMYFFSDLKMEGVFNGSSSSTKPLMH